MRRLVEQQSLARVGQAAHTGKAEVVVGLLRPQTEHMERLRRSRELLANWRPRAAAAAEEEEARKRLETLLGSTGAAGPSRWLQVLTQMSTRRVLRVAQREDTVVYAGERALQTKRGYREMTG